MGSREFVKFSSTDEVFLADFPEGSFDSFNLKKKNCSISQWDIVEAAQKKAAAILNHES